MWLGGPPVYAFDPYLYHRMKYFARSQVCTCWIMCCTGYSQRSWAALFSKLSLFLAISVVGIPRFQTVLSFHFALLETSLTLTGDTVWSILFMFNVMVFSVTSSTLNVRTAFGNSLATVVFTMRADSIICTGDLSTKMHCPGGN